MLLSVKAALTFTDQITSEEFWSQRLIQSAVIREPEIIGEAARAISAETRASYPQIPWTAIIGMRNRIVHQYFDVRLDVVWDVVRS